MRHLSEFIVSKKKGVFLGFGIASFVFAIAGFVVPFFFFERDIQALLICLSVGALLLFGFFGVYFLLRERDLAFQKEFVERASASTSILEGTIQGKENLMYRKNEPMTWIMLDNGKGILWCRLFGEFEGNVGEKYRFEISAMDVISSWEKL